MRLSTMLANEATADRTNNGVKSQYKKHTQAFADFCRSEYKIREVKDLPGDKNGILGLIHAYVEHLSDKGLQSSTIHTYIAPVCKGFHIDMKEVDKPKRQAIDIQKGRMPDLVNKQGQAEKDDPRFARLVDAAGRIGVRRNEYATMTGRSFGKDVLGYDCVTVRGKGGKVQHQRLLPQDREAVKALFDGSGRRVFSDSEMDNKIDLHSFRREQAQRAYAYYVDEIRKGKGDQLKRELIATMRAYHFDGDNGKRISRFVADIERSGGVYKLRGDNVDRARTQGKNTQYNRLALMCVSVWHLAHWRLDVTAHNYML